MDARERFERVTRAFEEVVELPPSQRDAAIERLCGDDDVLERDLRAMLEADDEADPIRGVVAREAARWIDAGIGDTIGRYTIVDRIGEGGMGIVFAAHDPELDRRIAVKLLHGASDSRRQRMQREAQAMATLNHPHVVPVFEIGEHEGRVFVAMELVEGETLRQWQERGQGWRDVLAKYLEAGRGLAAAHKAGLVHRDFKPDNAIAGRDGRVRVLDFGLVARHGSSSAGSGDPPPSADALDAPLTRTGLAMGTPAYMPPEQYARSEVDHRSDQFSFCVALWEALYGEPPFDGDTQYVRYVAVREGAVREPKPSEVPAAIAPLLTRGLAPKAADRWPDLAALLDRLERVRAAPAPGRRKRWLVVGGGFGVVAIGAVASLPWIRNALEERERERCHARAGEAMATTWNDTARAQVRSAINATDLPYAAATADTVVPRIDDYARRWTRVHAGACIEAVGDTAYAEDTLGKVHACLGRRRAALGPVAARLSNASAQDVESAASIVASLPPIRLCAQRRGAEWHEGADTPEVIAIRDALDEATALRLSGDDERAAMAAEAAAAEAEEVGREWLQARAQLVLGRARLGQDRDEEAATSFEAAYLEARAAGDARVAALAADFLTVVVGSNLGRHDEGVRWHRAAEAAALEQGGAADDPAAARRLMHFGVLQFAAGRYAEAVEPLQRALAIVEGTLGADHPFAAECINNLAAAELRQGKFDEAEGAFERALQITEATYGPEHPMVARVLGNLAGLAGNRGDAGLARRRFERALAIQEAAKGPEDTVVAGLLANLGMLASERGDSDEAESMLLRASAIFRSARGGESPRLTVIEEALGNLYADEGDFEKAKTVRARVLAAREVLLPAGHPDTLRAGLHLGQAHEGLGDHDRAKRAFEDVLSACGGAPGCAFVEARARFGRARTLLSLGQHEAAIAEAEEAARALRAAGERGTTELTKVEAWLADHRD